MDREKMFACWRWLWLVDQLPDGGCAVVVSQRRDVRRLRNLITLRRGDEFLRSVKVLKIQSIMDFHYLLGIRVPIIISFCFEADRSPEVVQHITMLAAEQLYKVRWFQRTGEWNLHPPIRGVHIHPDFWDDLVV